MTDNPDVVSRSVLFILGLALGLLPLEVAPRDGALQVRTADAARPKKKSKKVKKRRRRRKSKARTRPAPAPTAPSLPAPAPAPAAAPPTRGPTRIDFDDRLVRGQTNKSGAVVLFSRKATGLESMVNGRTSFKRRTLRTVYDR